MVIMYWHQPIAVVACTTAKNQLKGNFVGESFLTLIPLLRLFLISLEWNVEYEYGESVNSNCATYNQNYMVKTP